MDRANDRNLNKMNIGGRAFQAGLPDDQVQQLENYDSGNIKYTGLQMPKRKKQSNFWRMIEEQDADDVSTVTGAFNQQTGERKLYPLGGVKQQQETNVYDDFIKMTTEQRVTFAGQNPEMYERVKMETYRRAIRKAQGLK